MQSPLAVWLPFCILLKQPCIANQYLSEETVCCESPGQHMHGYFGCIAAAEPGYSAFLGTPQASPSCLEKKNYIFLGKKIEPLQLLILNVSMFFVFFWTIFGLIPLRLASLRWFLFRFFFFAFASPFLGCSTAVPFQFASAERCEFSCCISLAWCKHIARDMLKSSRWIEPERDNSKTVRRSMLKIRARVLIWSISASLNPDSLIYNLKRIHFMPVILLTPFYLSAKNITGWWKGYFS